MQQFIHIYTYIQTYIFISPWQHNIQLYTKRVQIHWRLLRVLLPCCQTPLPIFTTDWYVLFVSSKFYTYLLLFYYTLLLIHTNCSVKNLNMPVIYHNGIRIGYEYFRLTQYGDDFSLPNFFGLFFVCLQHLWPSYASSSDKKTRSYRGRPRWTPLRLHACRSREPIRRNGSPLLFTDPLYQWDWELLPSSEWTQTIRGAAKKYFLFLQFC